MCGIVGIALAEGKPDPKRVEHALARLQHRGPDDSGLHLEDGLALGHTRLAIIDPAGGRQPIRARGGDLVLIVNGEIYNFVELRRELEARGHRFTTGSDSEAVLHAYAEWGTDCLRRLHGMYAFALYDRPRRRLLLARDRLGIKPLFLHRSANGLAFASEIKALLPLLPARPEIDPRGLYQYLDHQFSTGSITPLEGIERLLPAEALVMEAGVLRRRWRYWTPLDVDVRERGLGEAREEFDALIDQVMTEHMRSDVPFGLFLSGGVDSSVLLALLQRHGVQPVRTFSVGFGEGERINELPLARRVAEQFATEHTEISPTRDDIIGRLPLTVWAADDLMRDYANLPTALLAERAGAELKVVFSGEGGDEVFAGYGRYRSPAIERRFKALLHPGSGGFRSRGTVRGRWRRHLPDTALAAGIEASRRPMINAWQESPRDWTDLQRMQYMDLSTALPDNLLVKTDRMLMAWSLEGRVPLVDHRIVEFGLSLPDRLKVQRGTGKAFLKAWAEDQLPRDLLHAPKRGFHVPIGEWLDAGFRQRLRELLPSHPALRPWFRPGGVRQVVDAYGRTGASKRLLWSLLQFVIWHQLFIAGDGDRPPTCMDPLELLAA